MSRLGFFGGSFNPVTFAHINLAIKVLDKYNFDKIIFVPIGDFYEKSELECFEHRYEMLNVICSYNKRLEVSDLERNQNKLYAIDIFEIIKKEYSNDEIYYIMGTDNLKKINSWKGHDELISNYKYIIFEREKNDFNNIMDENTQIKKHKDNFIVVSDEKYMDISSSYVREKIKKGEPVNSLIPREIENYIKDNHLYMP